MWDHMRPKNWTPAKMRVSNTLFCQGVLSIDLNVSEAKHKKFQKKFEIVKNSKKIFDIYKISDHFCAFGAPNFGAPDSGTISKKSLFTKP